MSNSILLVACFLLGLGLRRTGRFPDNTSTVLNRFVVYVSLPALTLFYVHDMRWDPSLLFPASMAWVLFALGLVFFLAVGRLAGWSKATIGGLVLSGCLANTSFLGLPMIEAYYGREYLGLGILIDQFGTYLVLSTVGLVVAAVCSSGELTVRSVGKRLITFPPFLAMVAAIALMPVNYPDWFSMLLQRLGDTLTPLALISIGYALHLGSLRGNVRPLGLGLLYKLVLGPALVALLFVGLLGGHGRLIQVTVFEAAMAPMIGGSIVAMEYDLDTPLVTLMLGVGIPLSFLTLPLWWYILELL